MNYGGTSRTALKTSALAASAGERAKSATTRPAGPPAVSRAKGVTAKHLPLFAKRVRAKEIANLTSQLSIMAKSGVDVASALQSLARQCSHPTLKSILGEVHEHVLAGNPLSEALAQYPTVFNHSFIASVAAGEASGRLPDVFQQLAQLLRGQLKLRNSVRAMLAYPVLLMFVSSGVLLALVLFVLPKFAEIFADFEAPLPVITQVLIAFSNEIRSRFWLWIPLAIAAAGGIWAFRKSPAGCRIWDRTMLYSPLCREVTRMLMIGRTCRLMGLMIESGVPLLDSIRLTRSSEKNTLFQALFERLEDDVLNGRGLTTAMAECPFVPGAAAEMIMTAEKTGSLGPVNTMVGQHFEEEGEAKLKELVSVAEPLITIVMGLIVAVIVMSVMLPLFDLSSAAGKGH